MRFASKLLPTGRQYSGSQEASFDRVDFAGEVFPGYEDVEGGKGYGEGGCEAVFSECGGGWGSGAVLLIRIDGTEGDSSSRVVWGACFPPRLWGSRLWELREKLPQIW